MSTKSVIRIALVILPFFLWASPKPAAKPAPVIANVFAMRVTASTASITWFTEQGSSSSVEYGQAPNYELVSPLDPVLTTDHWIDLRNLQNNTTYHFRVRSRNAAGKEAISSDFTFATSGAADVQ